MIKVLVVDDSSLVRKLLGRVFAGEQDFEVRTARDGAEALEQLTAFEPDVVTLDITMPEMDGLDCLNRIMIERPCPVVMVSSRTAAGAETTLEALRLGAVDFVSKPGGALSLRIDEFAPELLAKVRAAAGARLSSTLRLKERIRHRIGSGAAMRDPSPVAASPKRERALRRPTGSGLVLVGASTGGPPALEALLTALPGNFPWPILVAQHMPASFTGPFARRLDRICALTVSEVSRPTLLEAGNVYIGRGEADLVVSRRARGLTALAAPPLEYPWHPSTDRLVRTAMEQVGASDLIGVLLTGMGYDGAAAMTLMRMNGGHTIAEAAETAVVWGMPGELVKAGGASVVLPLPRIANHLLTMLL